MLGALAAVAWSLVPTPYSDSPPPSGPRTVDQWVLLLGTSDRQLADEAWRRVRAAGSAAVPVLTTRIQTSDDPSFVRLAVLCLFGVGRDAAAAAPVLEALIPRWPALRMQLVMAMANADPGRARPFTRDLLGCVESRVDWQRLACIDVAGDVGGDEILAALVEALDHADPKTRAEAARGLAKVPAARARAALEARLKDPELDVRLSAATTLLTHLDSAPQPDPLTTFTDAVCQDSGSGIPEVVGALERRMTAAARVETSLVTMIQGDDNRCRLRAAVVLASLDPNRARPAFPLVRQALDSTDETLRNWGVRAIGGMGAAARDAVPDLERLASSAPNLRKQVDAALSAIQSGSLRYQVCDDLRLIGVAGWPQQPVAYLAPKLGAAQWLFEARPGQGCLDGVIDRIESDAILFKGERVSPDVSTQPVTTRLALFAHGAPDEGPFAGSYTGARMSVDFEGDVATFVALTASVSGLGLALEEGTRGLVRVAARDAPWDAIVERGLDSSGFVWRLDDTVLRVARGAAADRILMVGKGPWSGPPISFSMIAARMDELMTLFEDISGLRIEYPPGPHEPVVVFMAETAWDKIFALVLASRHWTQRREGDRIHVEPLAPAGR
jgi:HEAT repeat protein